MSKWICDRGRSADMRLYPMCTWEGGAKCSALKEHRHDEHCEGGFCWRAGVHRQCHEILEVTREWEKWKKGVDDYFEKTPQKEWRETAEDV